VTSPLPLSLPDRRALLGRLGRLGLFGLLGSLGPLGLLGSRAPLADAQPTAPLASPGDPAAPPAQRVTLTLDSYRALLGAARGERELATWADTHVTLNAAEAAASGWLWVEVRATLSGGAGAWVALAPASVTGLTLTLDGAAVTPEVSGGALVAPTLGRARLQMRYPARLTRHKHGAWVALAPTPLTPRAAVAVVDAPGPYELTPPAADGAEVDLSGALALTLLDDEPMHIHQRRDLRAALSQSGDGVDLSARLSLVTYSPRQWVPVAPAGEALLSATLDGAPAVVRAEGDWLAVWVAAPGAHVAETQTRAIIAREGGQPRLALRLVPAPMGRLELALPGPREVSVTPALPALSTPTERDGAPHTLTAIDLPPLDALTLAWTEKRAAPEEAAAQFLAETYQLFSVQEGLLKGEARVELEVMRGALERAQVAIPEGVALYHVSGEGVDGWVTLPAQEAGEGAPEEAQGGAQGGAQGSAQGGAQGSAQEGGAREALPRRAVIDFGSPMTGVVTLSLKWQRVVALGERIAMPLVAPLGAFQQSGVVALYDGDRVGFTPAEASGTLSPTGQEALPQRVLQLRAGEKVSQAFRHVQAPGALFTSSTSERAQDLRFDAQVETLYTAREGSIRAQSQVLLNLKSGRVDAVTLSLPSACAEPQVTGPSLNRVELLPAAEGDAEGRARYLVRFTRRLEGALTLNVDTELLVQGDAARAALPTLAVEGAELTRGELGLAAEAGLEVTPDEPDRASALRRVAVEELPRSIRLRGSSELLYGYRFTRPWALGVALKRHQVVETLTARARALVVETDLLLSGQRLERVTYDVENQDRLAARFTLPEGARVQEVRVNGAAVRAQDEGGDISVPIPKRQASRVELIYERASAPPAEAGEAALTAPRSDLHTTGVTWLLRFSGDWRLRAHGGPLRLEEDAASVHNPQFPQLSAQARFSYDLLRPDAPALTLTASFSPRAPKAYAYALNALAALLALLSAGGLLRPARAPRRAHAARLALLLAAVALAAHLSALSGAPVDLLEASLGVGLAAGAAWAAVGWVAWLLARRAPAPAGAQAPQESQNVDA